MLARLTMSCVALVIFPSVSVVGQSCSYASCDLGRKSCSTDLMGMMSADPRRGDNRPWCVVAGAIIESLLALPV